MTSRLIKLKRLYLKTKIWLQTDAMVMVVIFASYVSGPFLIASKSFTASLLSFMIAVFILLIPQHGFLRAILGILLFAVAFIQFTYLVYAGKMIDEYFWIASFSANRNEALSFLNTLTIREMFYYLFFVFFGFFLMFFYVKQQRIALLKYRIVSICSLILIALILRFGFSISPVQIAIKNAFPAYVYTKYKYAKSTKEELIVDKKFNYRLGESLVDDIVLIIGESSSKSRYHSYGYAGNTTPNFDSDSGWIKFTDYVANGLNTQPNLKVVFSGKLLGGAEKVENDIFRLAKRAKFKTFYVDNNKYQNVDPIYLIGAQSDNYYSINGIGVTSAESDDTIKFDSEISQYITPIFLDKRKKLVVLHMAGSHPSQDLRYPKKFDLLNNAYDNTILYTDYLIKLWKDQILSHSAHRSVIFIYISDHGVALPPGCGLGAVPQGDYRSYGANDKFATSVEIPLLVRVNDNFKKKNKKLLDYLKLATNKPIDHRFVLPSIAELMGYKFIEGYDLKGKSIFSRNGIEFLPRLSIDGVDLDSEITNGRICR